MKDTADLKLGGKWKFSKIYKAVWESKVSCKGKLVFAALEWYGDKKFPSHRTLASMCSLSPAGIKRAIEELQKAGLLSKENRIGSSNEYELFPDGIQGELNLAHHELGQDEPGHGDLGGSSPRPAGAAHRELRTKLKTNETSEEAPRSIHQTFIDWWFQAYEKEFHEKYFMNKGKDGQRVKEMVSHYSLEDLQGKVLAGWVTPDRRDFSTRTVCKTIAGFSSMVNQLVAKKMAVEKKELTDAEILMTPDEDLGYFQKTRKWKLQKEMRLE